MNFQQRLKFQFLNILTECKRFLFYCIKRHWTTFLYTNMKLLSPEIYPSFLFLNVYKNKIFPQSVYLYKGSALNATTIFPFS